MVRTGSSDRSASFRRVACAPIALLSLLLRAQQSTTSARARVHDPRRAYYAALFTCLFRTRSKFLESAGTFDATHNNAATTIIIIIMYTGLDTLASLGRVMRFLTARHERARLSFLPRQFRFRYTLVRARASSNIRRSCVAHGTRSLNIITEFFKESPGLE